MASWWTTSVPGEWPPPTVDLNADVGEASDPPGIAVERALLEVVTSVHIACGGHAGDETSMRATVTAARDHGVRVGAHPSYPDRAGFGRRPIEMTPRALSAALAEQIAALVDVAAGLDVTVASIKPHGALYGEVGRDRAICDILLGVISDLCGAGTTLVLGAGALAVTWAQDAGVGVLREGFVDRAYSASGDLVGRQQPGSVYSDPATAAAQALGLVRDGTVSTVDGVALSLTVDTLCVHGDSPHAEAMACAVRRSLHDAGVLVEAPVRRP
jgi:UPF0271 protein